MSDESITFSKDEVIWATERVTEEVFKCEKRWRAHLSRDELHRQLLGRIMRLQSDYQLERRERLRLKDAEDKLRGYEFWQPKYKELSIRQTQYIELLESALARYSPEVLLNIFDKARLPYPKGLKLTQEYLLKVLAKRGQG